MSKKTASTEEAKSEFQMMMEEFKKKQENHGVKILAASIKDGFCHYTYEITKGIGLGNIRKETTKCGTVKESLRNAFAALMVHIACIDDMFKHGNVDMSDISRLKSHPFTFLFTVDGFKIKGGDENESVSFIGQKYLSLNDRSSVDTPYVLISDVSGYKFFQDLALAVANAREEVMLYHEGNYEPVEVEEEEEKPDPKQTKIKFLPGEDQSEAEKAKINEEFESSEF